MLKSNKNKKRYIVSSLELIKLAIQSINKKTKNGELHKQVQGKIQRILYSYGLSTQTNVLAEKITQLIINATNYINLKKDIENELEIGEILAHQDKAISILADKIIREVTFIVNPELWDRYYTLKAEEERKKISSELEDVLGSIKSDTKRIIKILCDNICSLDEYEAELAKKYDSSKIRINYDFFNYNDLEFRTQLKTFINDSSKKYIYIKGVSQDDALYATLFEICTLPIKDDVLIIKNPNNFEHSELSALKNKIYIIAYPTSEKEIIPLYEGRLIIPHANNEILQGETEAETIYLPARDSIEFCEALRRAGVENASAYSVMQGASLAIFNQKFLKAGKSIKNEEFIQKLNNEISQLKKLILLGEFRFYPQRNQFRTDFDYITEYTELNSRENLEKVLRKYSASEKKLFDISYDMNPQVFKSENINKVKIPKGKFWEIIFRDIEQSEIKRFYEFSLFILAEYVRGKSKSFYQGHEGPSRELISGIIETWIYISDYDQARKGLATCFLNEMLENPQYEYYIIPYALKFARINPYIFFNKCHDFVAKIQNRSIREIRQWWYSGFNQAFIFLADYYDTELTINFLMNEFLPICVANDAEFLIANFLHDELNPYQEDVLYTAEEFFSFLNRYPQNNTVYLAIFDFLPRAGERSWNLKPTYYFPQICAPLYHHLENSEKEKILHHAVDYVFQYAATDAERIKDVLTRTAIIEYGYSFAQIENLLKNFNTFNDSDKVKIEIGLRKKRKAIAPFKNTMTDRSEWLDSFIDSIRYHEEENKYLWLFHKDSLDFAPIYDNLKISKVYQSPELRGKTILNYLDSNFTLSTAIKLLKSGTIEDIEALVYIGAEYSQNKYNSEFFCELAKITINAFLYIEILLSKGNDISCIYCALNDLEKNKESQFFCNNFATILSYIPYDKAKHFLMRLNMPAVNHRFYEIASRGTIGNKHLTKEEFKDVLNNLFEEKDGENILFLFCYNGDFFSEEELVFYLEKVMKNIDKSKYNNGILLDKEFNRIRRYYQAKPESHDLIKDLEFWFLGIDVVKENSIFLMYIDKHPEFVGNLLKALHNNNDYGIFPKHVISDLFTYMKTFKLSDYCDWIDSLEKMAKIENFMDTYLSYISDLFTIAPRAEGFSFVPVESAAKALEEHEELRNSYGTAMFNNNNSHHVDGGLFLRNKGNIIKCEALRIKDIYSNLAKEMKYTANLFFNAAEREKYRERYE